MTLNCLRKGMISILLVLVFAYLSSLLGNVYKKTLLHYNTAYLNMIYNQ